MASYSYQGQKEDSNEILDFLNVRNRKTVLVRDD